MKIIIFLCFKYAFILYYLPVFCLHVWMCIMCVARAFRDQKRHRISCYRWMWATTWKWVLGIEPHSSARVAAVYHWTISPALLSTLISNTLFFFSCLTSLARASCTVLSIGAALSYFTIRVMLAMEFLYCTKNFLLFLVIW